MGKQAAADGRPAISAVTFDVGETLLCPSPGVGHVYAEVFAEHGIEADPQSVEKVFRNAWKKVLRETGGPTDETREIDRWRGVVAATLAEFGEVRDFDRLFEELWRTFAEPRRWRVREYARDVLSDLRARRLRLAVLSNWDSRLRPLLGGLGLARYFDAFFISAEVGWEKPNPRIFRAAEEQLGLPPSAFLHVGDSPCSDAAPARSAGWRTVLIGDGARIPEGSGPVIADLRELFLWLPASGTAPGCEPR